MNPLLPTDDEVARRIAETRVAVLEATQHVRSPSADITTTGSGASRNMRNIVSGVPAAAIP